MAAVVAANRSAGLNCTNSVPASAAGAWPGACRTPYLDGLLPVVLSDGEPTFQGEPPVRTRTVPARERSEHRAEVVVLANRHKVDGPAVEILVMIVGDAEIVGVRGIPLCLDTLGVAGFLSD